jgi:aminoglycoside/choline kinase family phosphotransferase
MEDLGDENLQTRITKKHHSASVYEDYRRLIEILLSMALKGSDDFDPDWTYQTRRYDRDVILQGECRYFVNAFLNGYLEMTVEYEALAPECERLADAIMSIQPKGFMHRDFQSRNVMVHNNQFYLIDFQGGRVGPPHYDLASLLIDPYVDLPIPLRETLLDFFAERLAQRTGISTGEIRKAYRYCALARNLQILGAYGFLTRRKGKPQFARYIPAAVQSLQQNLACFDKDEFPLLANIAKDTIPNQLSAL